MMKQVKRSSFVHQGTVSTGMVTTRNKLKADVEESRRKLRSALASLSDGQKSLIEVRYLGENVIPVENLAQELTKSTLAIETMEAEALRALMRGKCNDEQRNS